MKTEIEKLVLNALKEMGLPEVEFSVNHPQIEAYGDYATNVALVAAKAAGKNPRELAAAITARLQTSDNRLQTVSVAGPGFINFRLDNIVFLDELDKIVAEKELYGKTDTLQGKNVSVEYTDPNPFKELHLGHLYSNLIGEAIAHIMEANGAIVWRADFYGDTGLHVAKSVWGMRYKLQEENTSIDQLKDTDISVRQAFLGRCYAYGVVKYEEDEQAKTEITHLNTLIHAVAQELHIENEGWVPTVDYNAFVNAPEYDRAEIKELYRHGLAWSLAYFETLYEKLGTKFDGYYPESKVGELGYRIVQDNIKDGVFEKSGETVIYPGEKYGLHTRVFINKLGLPTYEAKDIGLAHAKYKDFPYDKSINVTGTEIKEYFKVVFDALKKINPKLGNATQALTHGMVRLPEGKMSSRTGNVITVEGLIQQAIEESRKIITNPNLTDNEKDDIAEKVGMASVKYALLKADAGNDVVFSFADSVTFNGNSGPYLQYTVARCNSVLAKADFRRQTSDGRLQTADFNEEELAILRKLAQFSEVVAVAADILSLHSLCEYLYDLSQRYNTFYNKHSILGSEQKEFRLQLTDATRQVMKNGLRILGIETPERM